tara:strand:+ start:884 stop:1360 length:477 start_codon:yes stop_codon:yes gene_type:complete
MLQSDTISPLIEDLAKLENKHQVACQACALYRLCLPLGLHREDLILLDQLVKRRQDYKRRQALFNTNDSFNALYVVRSGSFKTTISTINGREQVTGFYFPGEFIGLDAIHMPVYQSTAVALESSSVCAVPFDSLQTLGESLPRLQIQLLTRLSRGISG